MWLHWSEYLLARDEFYRWFQKVTVALAPPVELQLGLKQKQWQLGQARVLLGSVGHQAVLLERLLEEAAALFHRIGDPSVDEDAQRSMKAEYEAVKAKAQVGEPGLFARPPLPLASTPPWAEEPPGHPSTPHGSPHPPAPTCPPAFIPLSTALSPHHLCPH